MLAHKINSTCNSYSAPTRGVVALWFVRSSQDRALSLGDSIVSLDKTLDSHNISLRVHSWCISGYQQT